MAEFPVDRPWRLVFQEQDYDLLRRHLFPGDRDEHGAVLEAGLAVTDTDVRLLVRKVHLAEDGVDYVPGTRGYRKLRAEYISERIDDCVENKTIYLAVHNHGGWDSVAFSPDDLASHARGYPALLDILNGVPVGALVLAGRALAGDIWLPGGRRVPIEKTIVIGRNRRELMPAPAAQDGSANFIYDRQARLFGDAGQRILKEAKVAVVGLGGVGSLVAELLGRLGVGHIVLVDADRIEPSNLPRVVGARRGDALTALSRLELPRWARRLVSRFRKSKVSIAARVIREANPTARVDAIIGDVADETVAEKLRNCDYLFLAADTQRARMIFNVLVHQYLIPGVQMGAKVPVDKSTGQVGEVFTVVRPVRPHVGCLWCNQVINPQKLQEESQSEEELRIQRYVDDADVVAPSVITLNATTASYGVNDFLFYVTALASDDAEEGYVVLTPRNRRIFFNEPRKGGSCPMCSTARRSVLAMGDVRAMPTIKRAHAPLPSALARPLRGMVKEKN